MGTIEVDSLTKEFRTPSGIEVAVRELSLEVDETEFLSIVGPSGCGKSTTLRCIAGLEAPTRGHVRFDGLDYTPLPANERNFSMMFQNIALYPHMTVIENIAYPLKVRGVGKAQRREEAIEAAELMQVGDLLDKHPGDISGGQRQRVALARTIVYEPSAFLLDEPLSDLDAKLKVDIRKEIQRVHQLVECPTVYVTHDQEEALTMSDRIAVMNDGEIEQLDTPDRLYQRPANLFVAGFIGNPSMNFLEGTVVQQNGSLALSYGDELIPLALGPDAPAVDDGADVVVGARPVDVRLGSAAEWDVEAEITLVERVDERALVTLEFRDAELQSLVPANAGFSVGESVAWSFDPERVYLFDADSGELVFTTVDVGSPTAAAAG